MHAISDSTDVYFADTRATCYLKIPSEDLWALKGRFPGAVEKRTRQLQEKVLRYSSGRIS